MGPAYRGVDADLPGAVSLPAPEQVIHPAPGPVPLRGRLATASRCGSASVCRRSTAASSTSAGVPACDRHRRPPCLPTVKEATTQAITTETAQSRAAARTQAVRKARPCPSRPNQATRAPNTTRAIKATGRRAVKEIHEEERTAGGVPPSTTSTIAGTVPQHLDLPKRWSPAAAPGSGRPGQRVSSRPFNDGGGCWDRSSYAAPPASVAARRAQAGRFPRQTYIAGRLSLICLHYVEAGMNIASWRRRGVARGGEQLQPCSRSGGGA